MFFTQKSNQSTDTEKTISSLGLVCTKLNGQRAHIFIEEKPFSKGGFTSVNKGKIFYKIYVIKRFILEAILEIKNINKTVEKKETTLSLVYRG